MHGWCLNAPGPCSRYLITLPYLATLSSGCRHPFFTTRIKAHSISSSDGTRLVPFQNTILTMLCYLCLLYTHIDPYPNPNSHLHPHPRPTKPNPRCPSCSPPLTDQSPEHLPFPRSTLDPQPSTINRQATAKLSSSPLAAHDPWCVFLICTTHKTKTRTCLGFGSAGAFCSLLSDFSSSVFGSWLSTLGYMQLGGDLFVVLCPKI